MTYSAVTANLGCGGPHPVRRPGEAEQWLSRNVVMEIDVMFLQEVPCSGELGVLESAYDVFAPAVADRSYRCRSVVAVRRETDLGCDDLVLPTADYHGSYVAAARLQLAGFGQLVLMSVHASPRKPTSSELERWRLPRPKPRPSGAEGDELWDSDLLLASVINLHARGYHVLAAGDWNEARAWDRDHSGQWGSEFFAALEGAGLRDCTVGRWGREHATYGDYQLDHVIASPLVDRLIDAMPEPLPEAGSDHFPLRFTFAPAPAITRVP